MDKTKSYSEKLKDPRWQKKRLEILQRDDFKCLCCGEKEKTLHVHHFQEDYSIEPWGHDNISLVTLCEDCHKLIHIIFNLPFDPYSILEIVKFWEKIEFENIDYYLKTKQ